MEPSARPATSMHTVRHAKSCRVRATFLKKRCDSTPTSRAQQLAYRLLARTLVLLLSMSMRSVSSSATLCCWNSCCSVHRSRAGGSCAAGWVACSPAVRRRSASTLSMENSTVSTCGGSVRPAEASIERRASTVPWWRTQPPASRRTESNIFTIRAPGWWMLSSTVRRRVSAMARSAPTICSAEALSRPEVGSSRMSTAGSWTASTPMETRRRSPPERSLTLVAATRARVRSSMSASMSLGETRVPRRRRALKCSVSRTVRRGKRTSRWVTGDAAQVGAGGGGAVEEQIGRRRGVEAAGEDLEQGGLRRRWGRRWRGARRGGRGRRRCGERGGSGGGVGRLRRPRPCSIFSS
uniref:Uncharacterized protein n=1 Tax=Oryza brachyantha TaxID=4533 RepID=J3M324_ORYBR